MIFCNHLFDKQETIRYFYEKESDFFLRQIHKRQSGLEDCIKDTCESIESDSRLFGVYDDGKLVAFFSKYENEKGQSLNGFHVLKQYRNRDFLTGFWQIVKSKFEQSIYTGLYVKNEPAIKSLLKAGFHIHDLITHENKVFLIFKFE